MEKEEPSHAELLRSRWNDFRSRCYTCYPHLHPDKTIDIALRTKFMAEEDERKRKFENHEMSKEEVLHYLRAKRESQHRCGIQHGFKYDSFCWNSKPTQRPCLDKKARFRRARTVERYISYTDDFFELSNKSVPLYVLTSSRLGERQWNLSKVHACLLTSLCCYLFDKWFRPYHSDIDFNQFIAKIIVPMDLECRDTRPSAAMVGDIAEINGEVVNYLEAIKRKLVEGVETHCAKEKHQRPEPGFTNYSWEDRDLAASPGRVMCHYSVPALFKSLGVILCTEAWNKTGPSEIGNTSVCMFLTGMENSGLSAPITFDSIEDKIQAVLQLGPKKAVQTTLDTAIDFIMELERREASAAAGNPKDPVLGTDYPKPDFPEAYNHFFEGVTTWGPSSEWIDVNAYQKWTGPGARLDLHSCTMEEFERVTCRMLR
ncbi:hypothetical protein diail_7335 [Diaporthe ilicicola]|nr:hypothetical protein diail_7335 [Diaporthe ilicicola]